VIGHIHVKGDAQLLEVCFAGGGLSGGLGVAERRQKYGAQDSDHGNDDEELDERERYNPTATQAGSHGRDHRVMLGNPVVKTSAFLERATRRIIIP